MLVEEIVEDSELRRNAPADDQAVTALKAVPHAAVATTRPRGRANRRTTSQLTALVLALCGSPAELGATSLVPIVSLEERVEAWRQASGTRLATYIGDLTDPASRL